MTFALAGWGISLVGWAVGTCVAYKKGFSDGRKRSITEREFQTLSMGHGLPRTRR